jgi:hypothetical protein
MWQQYPKVGETLAGVDDVLLRELSLAYSLTGGRSLRFTTTLELT